MAADSTQRAEAAKRDRQRIVDDSIAAANRAREAAARDAESMRATIAAPIHYDYDKADLRDDTKGLNEALNVGLASPEHAAFAAKLLAARTPL